MYALRREGVGSVSVLTLVLKTVYNGSFDWRHSKTQFSVS